MKLYSKYIITRIAGPMALICITLTGIAWLINSIRYFKYIVNSGLNISTFMYLSALTLPSLLALTIPLSLFLGTLVAYTRLSTDSELTVLRSAGMPRISLTKPALIFAIGITFISYGISLYLLPTSYREFKDLEHFVRDKHGAALLQEGVFNSLSKGFTFYFRERDEQGNFRGILIHDNTKKDKTVTFMATSGYPIAGPQGQPRLMTFKGNAQEVNLKSNELIQTEFDSYVIDLKFFTETFDKKRWREPEERYLQELFFPEDTEDRFIQKLRSEGHHRILWPLYNIFLTIIALYAFSATEFNRRGQLKNTVITVVSAIGVFITGMLLKFLVAGNAAFTSLIYVIPILGIIASFYFLVIENRGGFNRQRRKT